jgi:RNase P subunit RPR2
MDVKPGDWFFGVYCASCGKPMLLFHDPSKGKVQFSSPDPEQTKFQVTCRACGHQGLYPLTQLQHLRAEQAH